MTSVTELAPAAGDLAGVAPARYVRKEAGGGATYAFESRFDGGEPVRVALLDGKASQLNRVEQAMRAAIADEHPQLSLTPRVEVVYEGQGTYSCLELPHRVYDSHVRSASVDGADVVRDDRYIAARNSSPADARTLLEMSPASIAFGSWDATRGKNQARFRSLLVGEIIGVLADPGEIQPLRGAGRADPVAPSVRLGANEMSALVDQQRDEMSANKVKSLEKDVTGKKAKGSTISASPLGLGSIPPTLDGLGLVSCRKIVRHHVFSFSALRQLRFGLGPDGDVAARALLAAWTLAGLALSDAELHLRANCDLREAGPSKVTLDGRQGNEVELEPLSVDGAAALLQEAIDAARAAGVRWEGQVYSVAGNPIVAGGLVDDEPEGGDA